MSIHELQQVLHDHADDVVDTALAGRAAAARREAVGIKWRRRAVGTLVVAVVAPVLGAALLGGGPFDRTGTIDPVDRGHSADLDVLSSFAGRELLDSEVVTGTNELVLEVPAGEHTELHAACWGVGPKYTLHVTLDGEGPGDGYCETNRPEVSQLAYGLTEAESGVDHTLRLWITPNYPDLPDVPAGVFLMAAAYRSPDVEASVTGQEVYALERVDGEDYELAAYDESRPGARTLRSTFTATDLAQVEIFSNASLPHPEDRVTVLLNGIRQSDFWLGPRSFDHLAARYKGPHTVVLRIRGDVPPDAVLGVVWRTIKR
ncbi:MAG TPA: hypothetical protein VFK52_02640 [Nocardioidaceae bacterium]|nr:hypothetical protein [Nocardioidaceae bacterium]